jgi:hypothetical protein
MSATGVGQHRVRVWFGSQPIADYRAEPALAARYAAAMARRFAGLRVINEPILLTNDPLPLCEPPARQRGGQTRDQCQL